jgi:hypothetical protein
MRMAARPIFRDAANAWLVKYHRHAGAVVGDTLRVSAWKNGRMVGVAVGGRPVSKALQDGRTFEITRNCTDGTRNACSFLYGRLIAMAKLQGWRRIITYTREDEEGASLRAVGFQPVGTVSARQWNCQSRPRAERDAVPRIRWEIVFEDEEIAA